MGDMRAMAPNADDPCHVEVFGEECFLIRGLLAPCEQMALLRFVQERDKTPPRARPCMNPSPKTLVLGENEPSIRFLPGEDSAINRMVEKASGVLKSNLGNGEWKSSEFKSISMAVIEYESPDGRFPPHIDHCNDSFVYLLSLGCTANFMVKGPAMQERKTFKFHSGDLLVFNASSQAAILHGVMSIDGEESCPEELKPWLRKHRYGVQLRLYNMK